MESEVLKLWQADKKDEIVFLLDSKEESEVMKCISNCVLRGKIDPLLIIKVFLACSQSSDEPALKRFSAIYIGLIKILQKNEINSDTSFKIVSLLLTELDAAQPRCLNDIAQFYVSCVKDGSFKGSKASDLLPKILSLLDVHESVPNGEGSIKGSELKSHLINSLCSCRWVPSVALHMAPLFKDIPLSQDELKFLIQKILRLFPELELANQPAVVFQLLVLSGKGNKKLVLEGLCKFYTGQDDANRGRSIMVDSEDLMSDALDLRTLRQIEGTAILHITQAFNQDQELGSELLKHFKNIQLIDPKKVIGPFNLCLLLSISQIHHFEEKIFEFVKATILKCLNDEDKCSKSLWARECYPQTIKTEQLVLEAVEHSTFDWDHVIQGLVKLGFSLMDSYGPKLVFGSMPESLPPEGVKTPTQLACQLGRRVLLKTFKGHEVVRLEILDQIFSHIIMRSTAPVTHYLDLLSDTVHSAPQLLLESSGKVQEICLKLAELPPKSADGLLMSIQPLLKLSPLLKDTIIIVLRKAMFARQLNARKIGVLGFLMILKNFKVLGCLPSSQISQPISLSQLQVDVHTQYNAASNEALCLEILGNLRRSFTQQADIRLSIYQGLWDVLHRNSQLMLPVLDMLLSQLKKYYEDDNDVCPPLRLDPCVITQGDQVFLTEPLSHLICCIQQCVRKSEDIRAKTDQALGDDDDDDDMADSQYASLKQLQCVLASLSSRLIETEMEDFEIDKNADFSLNTSVGLKNNINASLLLGTYETLIEYTFETGKCSVESCEKIAQLFEKHSKLSSAVKDKPAAAAGKRGRSSAPSSPTSSLMSMQGITNILRKILDNSDPEHDDGVKVLRDRKNLLPYIIATAIQKLNQICNKGLCDGETLNRDKLFSLCCLFGRQFYLHYVENQVTESDTTDKKLISQCLEGLSTVVTIATNHGKLALLQCLMTFERECEEVKEHLNLRDSEANEKIHKHIKKIQSLIITMLSEDSNPQQAKDICQLILILASLASHLATHSPEFDQVYNWVHKVASDRIIDDSSMCKQILSTLLSLSQQTKNLPQLLRSICQDIHSQFGDIQEDCEVEDKTHFLATKATHCPTSTVLTSVLSCLERELDDIEWVIKRHKAEMQAAASREDEESLDTTQVETLDRALCVRLGMLVNSFTELTASAVKSKPCLQNLLKALTKLYNTMSSLSKHYISLYTCKAGHMGSRFEKLVTLVGRQLTQPTYSMIIFVQMSEAEGGQRAEKKDKGKKKTGAASQNGVAKSLKQMKTIPNLVFAMEQLEKFLIQLSKKSKVNLMQNFKLSTSRDFRINTATVTNVVENAISSDDESMESDDEGHKKSDAENEKENNQGKSDDEEESSNSESEQENVQPEAENKDTSSIPIPEPLKKKKKLSK
ncbi:hypothetical protein RRG08_055131 [Elysia crispata]|uniref:Fanconi anemia group I protein n=1 Tax=Elysia crispata TaxID=231223 RepID=A0AAE1AL17_9GAST|nr:hypothetical protein RRG08_055131 [Elysia crispata]